ncbi:hypothetical protein [Serratia fonticola]|uniref:hypothetical protein n=1 Tax=Serratia fonticola TaxID=47917 RepID=UPI00301CDAE9
MARGITFDPYKTTNMQGGFNTESTGFTQGDAQDDPAVRLQLSAGTLNPFATAPIWAGRGIIEIITKNNQTGAVIVPATATSCDGFCVSNQAFHGLITPNSQVPQFSPGSSVHYFRLGSNARIPLPISADVELLADGNTSNASKKFVWDPVNYCVDVSANATGMAIRLLMVSNVNNLAAKYDASSDSVNWVSDRSLGLFLI